ncbi:TPA: hypothetical protein DIC62_00600 [Candidatus Nomurabacteria bacterium]|nr:hypothetical protein [Candidatus Nomurabacteria bacterium]
MAKPKKTEDIAEQIKESIDSPVNEGIGLFDRGTISTGSTLLDLEISGNRTKNGGLPGGIIVEIFGPSGAGKTSILAEICASAKANGGDFFVADPEARLDKEYARIYGLSIDKTRYSRPDTVPEMFEKIWNWEPKPENPNAICVFAGDSLAALSTSMEMEDEDKMGMRRAKEFSEWMRKTCRKIANKNWLVVLTNQERESPTGVTTPGGKAVPYYSSLRIRVSPQMTNKYITSTKTINGKTLEKRKGVRSKAQIKKSSIGDPYGEAPYSLIFNYGMDDLRENLQFLKDFIEPEIDATTGKKKSVQYPCIDNTFGTIDKAIEYVESKGYEKQIKQMVVDKWHEIQDSFKTERKTRERRQRKEFE